MNPANLRLPSVLLALALAAPAQTPTSSMGAEPAGRAWLKNLETSSFLAPEVDGRWLAFLTSEAQEGGVDLNGDGDAGDYVMHVLDRASGSAQSLGLAAFFFQLDGAHAVFLVDEASQNGADLNGDGDAFDQVLHLHAARTGVTTNLGIATGLETLGPQIGDGLVALGVSEFAHGVDLNGDGDIGDERVMHVHEVATGVTTNLALATSFSFMATGSGRGAFAVSEYEQGQQDLNGDGDVFDVVLHVFDASTGTTTNTGLAVGYKTPRVDGSLVLAEVAEAGGVPVDLNGDGDTLDNVPVLYDVDTGQVTSLGLAASYAGAEIGGGFVVISVDEGDQGNTDLNGDGDTLDYVDHVYELATGTTTSLGLATAGFLFDGGLVVVRVWESGHGFTDLNGDGDTADAVLHVHDPAAAATTNLAVAAEFDVRLTGHLAAFRVPEAGQAGVDLNGDGDTGDAVVHVYDGLGGGLRNLELAQAANGLQVHGRRVALDVDEAAQGGVSLNHDTDTSDDVLHLFDASTGVTVNLARAVEDFRLSNRLLTFEVREDGEGVDLNGDGDTTDDVVHVLRIL